MTTAAGANASGSRPSSWGRARSSSAAATGIGLETARVVGPGDVAALAVHIMSKTALTGATYDIDGGQQFIW